MLKEYARLAKERNVLRAENSRLAQCLTLQQHEFRSLCQVTQSLVRSVAQANSLLGDAERVARTRQQADHGSPPVVAERGCFGAAGDCLVL